MSELKRLNEDHLIREIKSAADEAYRLADLLDKRGVEEMTNEKLLEVIDFYDRMLGTHERIPCPTPQVANARCHYHMPMNHLRWCLGQMREFVLAGRKEKAMRWLGFVQGVLWSFSICSLHDLMRHVMPAGVEFDPKA